MPNKSCRSIGVSWTGAFLWSARNTLQLSSGFWPTCMATLSPILQEAWWWGAWKGCIGVHIDNRQKTPRRSQQKVCTFGPQQCVTDCFWFQATQWATWSLVNWTVAPAAFIQINPQDIPVSTLYTIDRRGQQWATRICCKHTGHFIKGGNNSHVDLQRWLEYTGQGMTLKDVVEAVICHPWTVFRHLLEYNLAGLVPLWSTLWTIQWTCTKVASQGSTEMDVLHTSGEGKGLSWPTRIWRT